MVDDSKETNIGACLIYLIGNQLSFDEGGSWRYQRRYVDDGDGLWRGSEKHHRQQQMWRRPRRQAR